MRVEWNERLKEAWVEMLAMHLKECALPPKVMEEVSLAAAQTFDALAPWEMENSRMLQVLKSYKRIKTFKGRAISMKALSVAEKIAPHLPAEASWLITPTQEGGVRFESDVLSIDICEPEDHKSSPMDWT